ncbi:MAG: hypothetical protein JNK75_05525 [Betaproteobacteria bacterium]|nr:hypothetical protein [Betaproteobacteria bacterium]
MPAETLVREFNHTLLWPVTLRPLRREAGRHATYWDTLKKNPGPWESVEDLLLIEDQSCLAGYQEFVYFLPYVQRFLYGVGDEGRGAQSSLHVFQRRDIKEVRIQVERDGGTLVLAVKRARLYFFYDVDIAIATLEVHGRDIALQDAVEIMDRFGRPYAPAWEDSGRGAHCLYRVEFWGDAKSEDGEPQLLSAADYGDREKYLELVKASRQTTLSLHWEFFLSPMVPGYLPGGTLKYHQIENKRIPIMTYLAFDNPLELTRGDMIRIGSAAKWGPSDTLPYAKGFLANFEADHCYDRYWDPETDDMQTRFMFVGVAFSGVSSHQEAAARLTQFRHQFFQIALIANFHKAALLSLSDRFSRAVERLNVRDFESVKAFKKHVRETLEVFLRFNHRYWFHELSNQVQASDFFQRLSHQMGSDQLYTEVREEAHDINEYLDTDRARKQADNAMRLTVVSSCGMVGTIVTGFLGMNLYSHDALPTIEKLLIFVAVFVPTVALAIYTVIISRRLANFMEALSSEGLTWGEKFATFRQIWYSNRRERARRRREDADRGEGLATSE